MQETGDDPMSELVRRILALFDEYSSRENAKHTLRAMLENARQGCWNGARPPYRYRTFEAERRGDKVKKRLEIDEGEAACVRRIFQLCLDSHGLKAIANCLNREGLAYRGGRRFSSGLVHRVLTHQAMRGEIVFNRLQARDKVMKNEREWVRIAVPPLIDPATFDAVQNRLASRRPTVQAPRTVAGPTLLTGVVTCALCGGGMTMRTGKGGRYRYYACSTSMRMGEVACRGQAVPMQALDEAVIGIVGEQLLEPASLLRLIDELQQLIDAGSQAGSAARDHAAADLDNVELRLARLLELVEKGLAPLDDLLGVRLTALRQQREAACRKLEAWQIGSTRLGFDRLDKAAITAGSWKIRAALADKQRRRATLRQVIDQIQIARPRVVVATRKSMLLAAALTAGCSPAEVRSFVPEWRPLRESNPCFSLERAVSWTARRRGLRANGRACSGCSADNQARPADASRPAGQQGSQ